MWSILIIVSLTAVIIIGSLLIYNGFKRKWPQGFLWMAMISCFAILVVSIMLQPVSPMPEDGQGSDLGTGYSNSETADENNASESEAVFAEETVEDTTVGETDEPSGESAQPDSSVKPAMKDKPAPNEVKATDQQQTPLPANGQVEDNASPVPSGTQAQQPVAETPPAGDGQQPAGDSSSSPPPQPPAPPPPPPIP